MGQVVPFRASVKPIRISARPQRNPVIEGTDPDIVKWPLQARCWFILGSAAVCWAGFLVSWPILFRILDHFRFGG